MENITINIILSTLLIGIGSIVLVGVAYYVLQICKDIEETNKAIKYIESIKGIKQIVYIDLDKQDSINILSKNKISNLIEFKIIGLDELIHKTKRVWTKDRQLKIEFTVTDTTESGKVDVKVYYCRNNEWILVEYPEELTKYMGYDEYSEHKDWFIEYKYDIKSFRNWAFARSPKLNYKETKELLAPMLVLLVPIILMYIFM